MRWRRAYYPIFGFNSKVCSQNEGERPHVSQYGKIKNDL
jgi:hypothetical protein